MSDPLTRLAELPSAEPDPARSARTRERCRARLERQAPRPPAAHAVSHGGATTLWQAVIVVLGAGYMTEAIIEALRVYGLL